MRHEEPVNILEIIMLWEQQHLSQRAIASSVNCGKSTVGDIQRRCLDVGLTYDKATAMTYDDLIATLYPKLAKLRNGIKPEPDWDEIHMTLTKHPRMNLQFIWT